jgi:thiol-disulfide isomerase/thioredoxin
LIDLKYDVAKLRKDSESVHDYVSEASKVKDAFATRRAEYNLDAGVVKDLKKRAKEYIVIVFSAEWCPDCMRNVPVLDLIADAAELEVRVFGHIMRDAKSNTRKWAVPPSPPEVYEFNVPKIPLIAVIRKDGDMIGEIVENPPPGVTVEKALLDIMK